MKDQPILERGPSKFVSYPILHKKNNLEYKCVLDTRWVNSQTVITKCKMLTFEEILALLGRGNISTKCDVSNAFTSIRIGISTIQWNGKSDGSV